MLAKKQFVFLFIILCFGFVNSEIELTFSNEEKDAQSFIVKTESQVQNNSDTLLQDNTLHGVSSGESVITMLKIMKGDVVLLEKSTIDIGRDGYDMDIDSDLLDTGENVLGLLLLSANGTVIQQENITVFSPPPVTAMNNPGPQTEGVVDKEKSEESGRLSMLRSATTLLGQRCSSFYTRMLTVTDDEDRYARLVAATCGSLGVAAGGAFLFSLRTRRVETPPALIDTRRPRDPKPNGVADVTDKKYTSKFPKYPVSVVDFASPKAMTTKVVPPTSTNIMSSVKDLVLGRPSASRSKSLTLLVQGSMALLGAQAARSLVSRLSHRHEGEEQSRGGIFRIGRTKVKKRWRLGQFLRLP
jgi:hypothetical protein